MQDTVIDGKDEKIALSGRQQFPDALAAERDEIRAYNSHLVHLQQELQRLCKEAREVGHNQVDCCSFDYSFPSDLLARYARDFKRAIRPMDADNGRLVRLGSANDGGYVMLDPGRNGIAYSLGIDTNVDWDLDMAGRGFQVFQYDGSIQALPVEHTAFHFQKAFIGSSPAPNAVCKSLSAILRENGHEGQEDIILKMDIEGAEWKVFEKLSPGECRQFRQIVLELHLEAHDIGRLPLHTAALRRLNRTHQVVHAHVNNNGPEVNYNGERFWFFYELCYVRRDDYRFTPSARWYPTELDAPCWPHSPDVQLGYLGK